MKTRTLILLALACGLAILVAGGIQLVRISQADEVQVTAVGQEQQVGELRVAVLAAAHDNATVVVDVRVAAPPGGRGVAALDHGWILNQGGDLDRPSEGTCRGLSLAPGATVECTVAFPARDGSRVIAYSHDGTERRWAI